MKTLEQKLLLFYLGLAEDEKLKFKKLLGEKNIKRISQNEVTHGLFGEILKSEQNYLFPIINESKTSETDTALMQIIRKILSMSESNNELIRIIEEVTGSKITRPDKRAKYELKGMLLEELLNADRIKLKKIRNQLLTISRKNKTKSEVDINLSKWFNIIMGNSN